MSRAKTVAIDGDKLRNLITASGFTMSEASELIGNSKSYLTDVCKLNRATMQCINLIELVLKINRESFLIPEKKEEVATNETDRSDSGSVIELLQAIKNSLEKIEKIIEERDYEQKIFNLPFSDSGDSVRPFDSSC